ncbi:MAG: universal stress protein [Lutibacter sp.]|nr:universal stress protein [Lutibacter sp.]
MKKMLVTTDLSKNAKAGLRFAIQLATQSPVALTFFYSYHLMKPTSWSDAAFAAYKKSEAVKNQKRLNQYVNSIYKNKEQVPKNIKYVVKEAIMADSAIREYALNSNFDYICISKRGAGYFKKILGTTTSSLINFSTVPVIVVPNNYRTKSIKNLLYFSDLDDLDKELKKVVAFANPLGAKVKLLHFNFSSKISYKKSEMEETVNKYPKSSIDLRFIDCDSTDSLISKINESAALLKPSLLIMFTRQNRSFIEKIFYGSKSESYAFSAKIPLLVFNKTA